VAESPLLTLAEAAEFLGVSERTVQRLAAAGDIPRRRISTRTVRYAQADLVAYIRRSREVAEPKEGRDG
jgi:excisionase family DNA binding protein